MHILLLLAALNWNADLTQLATELPQRHPDAFHQTTRAAFEADIEKLRARVPELQPHEVVVELARIVASIGDGHTRLTLPLGPEQGFFQGHSKTDPPKDPALLFHAIPLRFVILSQGVFTTDGREVERIGRMTAVDAVAAVAPVAHRDNESQLKEIAASYLPVLEVLHARGVIESVDEVPVTYAGGETITYRAGAPPAQPRPEGPWSFRHLPEQKAVYFRFDEVANAKEETLAQFAERLFRFVEEKPVDKLVIDLRNNWGGNGLLNRSIVHGLIRSRKLQAPGSVFVLIGRRTFSASMFLLLDLEQHTNAIFIGEPTGGKPSSYGDSRKLILGESGLTVRISSLYWQADPRDKRDAIPPHVYVEPAIEGDPALAEALDFFGAPTEPYPWAGTVTVDYQRIAADEFKDAPFTMRFGRKRTAGTMKLQGLEFLVVGRAR